MIVSEGIGPVGIGMSWRAGREAIEKDALLGPDRKWPPVAEGHSRSAIHSVNVS
jgi:hypothetical protein